MYLAKGKITIKLNYFRKRAFKRNIKYYEIHNKVLGVDSIKEVGICKGSLDSSEWREGHQNS